MRVLKFGGTSVGTVESLLNVKKIVEAIEEPHITVVSALGGLTDKLIATANLACRRQPWIDEWQAIAKRHHDIIRQVVLPQNKPEVTATVTELLNGLSRNFEGIELLGQLPLSTLDAVVSFGERMSAPIVAGMIEKATLQYSPDFIKTEKWFGRNIADIPLSQKLIKENFTVQSSLNAIVPGFIAADKESGETTNLGRGGSDFTAALIASALNADVLDIWTDVDGFLTTDPRIVPSARLIPEMSFVESMELCSFGAKVIYPPTIYPVFHKNIPIRILNTFNPQASGTLITDTPTPSKGIARGISAIKQMALITLEGSLCTDSSRALARSFNALAKSGIPLWLMSQPQENSYSIAVAGKDAEASVKALEHEFAPDIINGALDSIRAVNNLSVIAMVADNIREATGTGARVMHTLQRNGIEVLAGSEGSSKTTVTVVIQEEQSNQALNLIHDLLFSLPEQEE